MRKWFAVLLLVFIVSCSGGKLPPVTQVCDPPQVLVNGVCVDPVTPEPPPPEPPPPPPDNLPIQQKRDHSVFRSAGFYGIMTQSKSDVRTFFASLPKEINAVSIFGLSGWQNYEGFYPWPVKGNGYDLKKLNPEYFAKVDLIFDLAARYDIIVEWCFDTKYLAGKHWSKYPAYGKAETPYCFPGSEVWCDMNSTRLLYENWNRHDHTNCSNFSWLCWKTGPNDVVLSVTGTGKLGPAKVMYGRAIADSAKRAYGKNKNFKIYVRPFNEEDGDWANEDHRIENWYDMEFKARGFKVGANYRVIENSSVWVEVMINGKKERRFNIPKMIANQRWLKARNRWMEVHNCDSKVAQQFIDAGADMNAFICDMDAVDDDQIDTEARKLLALQKAGKLPKFGIKPSDRWIKVYKVKDWNSNMNDQMPELKAIFQ